LDGFPEDGKDGKERKHLILSNAKDLAHEFGSYSGIPIRRTISRICGLFRRAG
jgi:hypothetical protein